MFDMTNQNFQGPMPFDDQSAELKKRQMMAEMLTKQAQQAGQNQSTDSVSGGLNIANALLSGYAASKMNDQNASFAEKLKRAQMMGGGNV